MKQRPHLSSFFAILGSRFFFVLLAFTPLIFLASLYERGLNAASEQATALNMLHKSGVQERATLPRAYEMQHNADIVFTSSNSQHRAKAVASVLSYVSTLGNNTPLAKELTQTASFITTAGTLREESEMLFLTASTLTKQANQSLKKLIAIAQETNTRETLLGLWLTPPTPKAVGQGTEVPQGHTEQHIAQVKELAAHLQERSPAQAETVQQNLQEFIAAYTKQQETLSSLQAIERKVERLGTSADISLQSVLAELSSPIEGNAALALVMLDNSHASAVQLLHTFFYTAVAFLLLLLLVGILFVAAPLRWVAKTTATLHTQAPTPPPPSLITEFSDIASHLTALHSTFGSMSSQTHSLAHSAEDKREMEEVMRAVFTASLDGYFLWTRETMLAASPGMLFLLEAESLEQIISNSKQLHLPDKKARDDIFETASQLDRYREEFTFNTLSGMALPCELTHIFLHNSTPQRVLTYVRDRRLQRRTEEAMLDVQRQAEQASQSKSEFLGRMSHELRTPLNCILGFSHVALGKQPAEPFASYFFKIQHATHGLLRLINSILDFSHLRSGTLELFPTPFALDKILHQVEEAYADQAKAKKITFKLTIDPNIPHYLKGDGSRLGQVLSNLCDNAIRFTKDGMVQMKAVLTRETPEYEYVRFVVHDTGVGIPPENLENIFKAFSQPPTYSARRFSGAGLGLVLCKELVEMMGGSLHVESEVGVGTIFTFTVPFRRCEEHYPLDFEQGPPRITDQQPTPDKQPAWQTTPAIVTPPPVQENSPKPLLGTRALLVEDNDINQEIAIAMLDSLGVSVVIANNGLEAVTILQTQDVDIIFMDIQMPLMDGLDAAKKIRTEGRESIRNVPILALTAHGMREDREKSIAAGMNDHLIKPISIDKLHKALEHWLAKR